MKIILELKKKIEEGQKLKFIHTPKCAGTYAEIYLKFFKISDKGHKQAHPTDGITFTIIRHPADRFESLLNYRLGEKKSRGDWPSRLKYVYNDKSVQLNEILEKMDDKHILDFRPYRTLTYWSKGVDVLLTIEEFLPFLEVMGYKTDKVFSKRNVSKKTRGTLSEVNRKRLENLFKDDLELYNKWTRKDKK